MRLTTMKKMLIDARLNKNAVGAFEFWSYDSARAIVMAAARKKSPVILQVGHFERDYMGGYRNAYKLAVMAADSPYPVALHLDHAEEFDEVMRALDAGFTSVMIDASMKPFAQNVKLTQRVVYAAAAYGATVEAELGKLSGSEGNIENDDSFDQTDPGEAARFVQETGIDALAVSIGTAHGFYTKPPRLNLPRLAQIAAKVAIPLVLHGGSATPDNMIVKAIELGIAKINICTEFIFEYGRTFSAAQAQQGFKYNVFSLFKAASDAAGELVERKIELFAPNARTNQG